MALFKVWWLSRRIKKELIEFGYVELNEDPTLVEKILVWLGLRSGIEFLRSCQQRHV